LQQKQDALAAAAVSGVAPKFPCLAPKGHCAVVSNGAEKEVTVRLPSQPSPHNRPDDILRQTKDARALPGFWERDRLRRSWRIRKGISMLLKPAIAALLLLAIPAWGETPVYSDETPIEVLAADPAAAAVVNKDLPGLLTDAQYPIFKSMSLKAIQQASNGDLSKTDVEKTVADLQALARR
jgi:hypothetical protein